MERKYVTYKNLKVGQEIHGYKDGNLTSGFTAYVKEINPAFVTVEKWRKGGTEEKLNSTFMFSVEMTEEEFKDKYREKAKEVVENIQKPLHRDEIGYHEMWNSWLFGTAYEVAAACVKENIRIVGNCKDITPKRNMISGEKLDLGVCAEYEDGERFWCHYSAQMLEDMLELFNNSVRDNIGENKDGK